MSHFAVISDHPALAENTSKVSDKLTNCLPLITRRCAHFHDDHLIRSLEIFLQIPIKARNQLLTMVMDLQVALDNACVLKSKRWDLNKQLLVCDMWYHIPLGNKLHFVFQACRFFEEHVNLLTPEHLNS